MIKKILLVFLVSLSLSATAQKTISGTFTPADAYNFGILYMIDVNNVFYKVDSNIRDGVFTVKTKENMEPGMYRLVYDLPQNEHFFDFIYSGKEDIEFAFSSETGVSFVSSEENRLWYNYKNAVDTYLQEVDVMYADSSSEKQIKKRFKAQTQILNELEKEAEGTVAAAFIRAYTPYIPSHFETVETYHSNRKKNYWKTVDFGNIQLQKSGLPLEMALKYVFNFVEDSEQPEASRKENVDILAKAIVNQSPVFQKALLTDLWQFMVNNEQIDIANYLSEEHLIGIAEAQQDAALSQKLRIFKNTSIGALAPNFFWEEDIDGKTVNTNLHALDDAENYLIIFWSSLCSHCLSEVPKIHGALKNSAPGTFHVIAVGLEDEPYDWQNRILDMPNFSHVLGLGKWDNKIGDDYDVSATPTYYLLDATKHISAKPETLEELMQLIAEDK